jgi:hypothetical protein
MKSSRKSSFMIIGAILAVALISVSISIYMKWDKGIIEGKWMNIDPDSKQITTSYYIFRDGAYYTNMEYSGESFINLSGNKSTFEFNTDKTLTLNSAYPQKCENGEASCNILKYNIKFENFGKVMVMTKIGCQNECEKKFKKTP